MATPFAAACSVAITNNYDTVGTLTRSTLKGLTPTQVKALFTDGSTWNEMSAMLKTQFEMAACGVRRYGFYDWIMTSARPGMAKLVQTVKRDKSSSLIQPFIMGRQMSVYNDHYWVITTGFAAGAYTPGVTGPLASNTDSGATGALRVIRMVAGYGVPLDAKYFLPNHQLYVMNQSGGGSSLMSQYRVSAAAVSAGGDYVDVLVEDLNSFDSSTSDAAPIKGLVIIGANNVNDFEKYCYNPYNYNPIKFVPFWYQTRRRMRRVDSAYMELFQKLMEDNQWFAQFQDLPLAERNRQDELRDQKEWVNSFFFGRPWSNAQRLEGSPNWTSLPQITSLSGASVDPGTGGQLQAYRANMIGVYPQLQACNRVFDSQGAAVDIKDFLENKMYDVWRARTSRGIDASEIDIYTDSLTADEFFVQFIAYSKDKTGDIVRIQVDPEVKKNGWGFQWRSFRLYRPQGVTVNIITNEFFDDIQNMFSNLSTGSEAARGRFLAVLDLGKGGSIYPAVLASNRKVYETGQIEQLAKIDSSFSCVMENPTIRTSATSETTTALVECPLNSHWQENFSGIHFS